MESQNNPTNPCFRSDNIIPRKLISFSLNSIRRKLEIKSYKTR